jgi:hypothetical protein
LCRACGLIHDALNRRLGITGNATDALLNLAAEISRAVFDAIFIHDEPLGSLINPCPL